MPMIKREENFFNPYSTTVPVYPPLFVGRDDVFDRIRQEIWDSACRPTAIILHGHRRMGKSSILRNVGDYVPAGSLSFYVDLRGELALAQGTHHLLSGLAATITWAARKDEGLDVREFDPTAYEHSTDAWHAFQDLLRDISAALGNKDDILILALDDFEALDEAVQDGRVGNDVYDRLRTLFLQQHIVPIFASSYALNELSLDCKEAAGGAFATISVSYLSPETARQLITSPNPDFSLDYHPAVVAEIVKQTHGQPLLIQYVCRELVSHVNQQLFEPEEKVEREARVLPEDLVAVLSDEFVYTTPYFTVLWRNYAAGRPAVEKVLEVLARLGPVYDAKLVEATELAAEELAEALTYLTTCDLIARDEANGWDLSVPLMSRWLWLRTKGRVQS